MFDTDGVKQGVSVKSRLLHEEERRKATDWQIAWEAGGSDVGSNNTIIGSYSHVSLSCTLFITIIRLKEVRKSYLLIIII